MTSVLRKRYLKNNHYIIFSPFYFLEKAEKASTHPPWLPKLQFNIDVNKRELLPFFLLMLSVLAFWENWERQGARDGSWEVGLNLG
jgi:hypothetical protein